MCDMLFDVRTIGIQAKVLPTINAMRKMATVPKRVCQDDSNVSRVSVPRPMESTLMSTTRTPPLLCIPDNVVRQISTGKDPTCKK